MEDTILVAGIFRSLSLSALIILGYAKVIQAFKSNTVTNVGVGVLFAIVGILSMTDPFVFSPGLFYDGRVPILALAYSFSGLAGTVIATVVIGGYRLWLGGVGATTGLFVICIAAFAGIAIEQIPRRFFTNNFYKSLALGVAASMSAMSMFALPIAYHSSIEIHVVLTVLAANIIGVVILYDFLSNEKKRLRLFRTLEHDAAIDPLTKLANRRAFEAQAANALTPVLNPSGDYAVIMIDIDHFKAVNDTYGHDTGDAVLANVAHIITRSVRASDIVARFGGEEIVVLLPGVTPAKAMNIAELIRQRIEEEEFPHVSGGNLHVTISAGAAVVNMTKSDILTALKAADSALYAAKKSGRNKVAMAPLPVSA